MGIESDGTGVGTAIGRGIYLRRLAKKSMMPVAIRVLSGNTEGLKEKWLAGVLETLPDGLRFTHTLAGFGFLRRPPIDVRITNLVGEPRRLNTKESLKLTPLGWAIVASTLFGEVEIGVDSPNELARLEYLRKA